MSKLKKDCRLISECVQCSHCFKGKCEGDNRESYYCKYDLNRREINMIYSIPSWCPLEDVE